MINTVSFGDAVDDYQTVDKKENKKNMTKTRLGLWENETNIFGCPAALEVSMSSRASRRGEAQFLLT